MQKLQKQFLSPSTPWQATGQIPNKHDSFGDLSIMVESSNSIMIDRSTFKFTQNSVEKKTAKECVWPTLPSSNSLVTTIKN